MKALWLSAVAAALTVATQAVAADRATDGVLATRGATGGFVGAARFAGFDLHLVTWIVESPSEGMARVFGARIRSGTGEVADPVPMEIARFRSSRPYVAAIASQPQIGLIRYAWVHGNGNIAIASMEANSNAPIGRVEVVAGRTAINALSLACAGTSCVVAWREGQQALFMVSWQTNQALTEPLTPVQIATTGLPSPPVAAASGSAVLLVWKQGSSEAQQELRALIVGSAGASQIASGSLGPLGALRHAAIATGTGWDVPWTSGTTTSLARLSSTGTLSQTIATSLPATTEAPRVGLSTEGATDVVVSSGGALLRQRVTTTAQATETLLASNAASSAYVADDRFALAISPSTPFSVLLQHRPPSSAVHRPTVTAVADQVAPALDTGRGGASFAAWSDLRAFGANADSQLRARVLGPDGEPGTAVATLATGGSAGPAVIASTADGTAAVIAQVRTLVLSTYHLSEDGTGKKVTDLGPVLGIEPALRRCGEGFVLASQPTAGSFQVDQLSRGGERLTRKVYPTPVDGRLAVACDVASRTVAVAWLEQGQVRLRRVSLDDAVVDVTPRSLSQSGVSAGPELVAANGSFYVLWFRTAGAFGTSTLEGVKVPPSGAPEAVVTTSLVLSGIPTFPRAHVSAGSGLLIATPVLAADQSSNATVAQLDQNLSVVSGSTRTIATARTVAVASAATGEGLAIYETATGQATARLFGRHLVGLGRNPFDLGPSEGGVTGGGGPGGGSPDGGSPDGGSPRQRSPYTLDGAGCSSTGSPATPGWLTLLVLALVCRSRRSAAGFTAGAAVTAVAAILLVPGSALAAAPAPKLMFLGVKAEAPVEPSTGRAITDFVQTELARLDLFSVVTEENIGVTLGIERQRQLMACGGDQASCIAELAGALNVERALVGSLARVGESVLFQLTLLDARSGTQLGRVGRRLQGARALDEALTETAPLLRELLGRDPLVSAKLSAQPGAASGPVGTGFSVGVTAQVDVVGRAVAPALGLTWDSGGLLGAAAQLIIASRPVGGRLEVRLLPLRGAAVLPHVALGTTFFGVSFAPRAAVGAGMAFGRWNALVEVGGEYFLGGAYARQLSVVLGAGVSYSL